MSDWTSLRAALGRCRRHNVALPVWWRDDDAIQPTAALERLHGLCTDLGLPIHLAVIPKSATSQLADFASGDPAISLLVHGWAHINHAPDEEKKSEFGQMRTGGKDEIHVGFQRIKALFRRQALPVFVPPWNRFDHRYLPELPSVGFKAVSTFAPREAAHPYPKLQQINCHADPINWRGDRSLVPVDSILAQTVACIDARIEGREDATEPFGYLTHHLVHTEEVWEFSHRFIAELMNGGAISTPLSRVLEGEI